MVQVSDVPASGSRDSDRKSDRDRMVKRPMPLTQIWRGGYRRPHITPSLNDGIPQAEALGQSDRNR
jgi:hypothetical protein